MGFKDRAAAGRTMRGGSSSRANAWIIATVMLAACAGDPADELAAETCATFRAFEEQRGMDDAEREAIAEEDLMTVLDVPERVEEIRLRATAEGLDTDQVAAKVHLECGDAIDAYNEADAEMAGDLQDIIDGIDLDLP